MPVLLQAAVHVRENKAGKAEEILGQFADKFPDNCNVILLERAQVAAAAGHPQIAAESLAKIPDIQQNPATVATIVSLKERAGDIDGADAVYDSAIRWWSNAMTENNKLNIIMQEAAAFKLRHGRKEEAAHLYEELVKSHESMEALVGLIQTAADGDVEEAESYEKQLKPLPSLKSIDVDCLEKTSGAKHVDTVPNVGAAEAMSKDKAKKKRKRKPKYPKGFDPANPGPTPDPERWLPKGKDLVTDQRERIREQLKLEVLREQWLKWQHFVVIPNQTSQSIPKEPLRMQASNTPSLHRDQERNLGSNQRSIHHFLIEDSEPIRHICMVPLESSPSLFHKLHLIRTVVIQRPHPRILRGLNYKGLDTERHGVVLCDIFARICHIGVN